MPVMQPSAVPSVRDLWDRHTEGRSSFLCWACPWPELVTKKAGKVFDVAQPLKHNQEVGYLAWGWHRVSIRDP